MDPNTPLDFSKFDINSFAFWSMVFAGAVLAGVFLVYCIRKYVQKGSGESITARGEMMSFRQMFEAGLLTQEEYDRLRNRLGKRAVNELDERAKAKKQKAEKALPPEPPLPTDIG